MSGIYKELYFLLFNCITYALEAFEQGDQDRAKKILIQAQIQSEEIFISNSESNVKRLTWAFRRFFPFSS